MDSVHFYLGSGHSGSQQTLSLLRNRYWWVSMSQEVYRFIHGCPIFAISKTLARGKDSCIAHSTPTLVSMALGVYFITDLSVSNSFTCILVVVDQFSKVCHLIPMKGLPTTSVTAEAHLQQVFRNYGLPEDMVSDQGPQFILRVWKSFFKVCQGV